MNKFLFAGIFGLSSFLAYKNGIFNFDNKPDYYRIKNEIRDNLWDRTYEDNHLGPLLVRLAWHASGTYDKNTNTGGSNGATMRFNSEANSKDNLGLNHARDLLEKIKKNHPQISYADLWIFAAYVAIESMGGPKIEFCAGRKDALDEKSCPPNGRLPDAKKDRSHMRDVFYRMGLNDQDIVALIGGGHCLGSAHTTRTGFEGYWTHNPIFFSNDFFRELFDKTWVERSWDGPKQYEDLETKQFFRLPTDMEIRDDPEFSKWAKIYRDDEKRFFQDFGKSFKKLTELGCNNLTKIDRV